MTAALDAVGADQRGGRQPQRPARADAGELRRVDGPGQRQRLEAGCRDPGRAGNAGQPVAAGDVQPFPRAAAGPAHATLRIADQHHAAEMLDDALEQPDVVALDGRSGRQQAVGSTHDVLSNLTGSTTP
jgi:hypothetical protein